MKAPALIAAAACALGFAAPALADKDQHRAFAPPPPKLVQECGSCHLVYPAGLLPAASWQRLMSGLPRHFGSDASLDEATAREIGSWLVSNAGSGRRGGEPPPEDRITRSAWFERKHREVPAPAWSRPSIGSAARCAACHPAAEKGSFDEHAVRIPR